MRKLAYEIMRVGAPGGLLDVFISGLRAGQPQVLSNGRIEKVGFLRDQRNLRAEFIESERPKIVSLQQDSPTRRVPEAK